MNKFVYVNVYEKHYQPMAFKSVAKARKAHNPKFNNVYLGVVKLPLEYVYVQ